MNDLQRQLALESFREDIENLQKYNTNYQRKLQEIDEAIRELEEQKDILQSQIKQNTNLIDALEATIVVVSDQCES